MIGFANFENTFALGMLPLALRLPSQDLNDLDDFSHYFSAKKLFQDLAVTRFDGEGEKKVTCLITDSRRVVPGALFFAIEGLRADGNHFIDEAIDRGAVGIVSSKPNNTASHMTYIQVPDVRLALASIAKTFYQAPDHELSLVGITGTNGKTTVATLTQFLLSKEKNDTGLLGTVRYDLGQRTLPAYKTTPESVDIYGMLRQMCSNGCRRAVMEVSSHAVDQKRVQGLKLPVLAFLNLTQDHMDYHQTMDAYFETKARLFTGETGNLPSTAIVNRDDPYGRELIEKIPKAVKVITFGLGSDAMIRADRIDLGSDGSEFRVTWPDGQAMASTRELGCYNVSNILAALAICYASGYDIAPLLKRIKAFEGVPGRMERIDAGQPYNVLVDYAHTDDALLNALTMLKGVTMGRIHVVFGCGGDRDRDKRALMTSVVQRWADESWATSDNPRKESQERIFDEMKRGVSHPDKIHFVSDRRRAISMALEASSEGDCVLIAGKGHETFQEFADTVVPFDDRIVARELLKVKAYIRKK